MKWCRGLVFRWNMKNTLVNHNQHRYVVYGASIEGSDEFEGFCYAYRNDNELKLMQKIVNSETTIIQRMTWESESDSWIIQSRPELAGKEDKIFLDMKLMKLQ